MERDRPEAYGKKLETNTPIEDQRLVSRGKVLTDRKRLIGYYIYEGETIEMSALLLGGTKNKSLSPNSNVH